MWLGDIYQLPDSEQYLLRSKNIPSDHSIGSEFYDGQIECIFTEHSKEDALFMARSNFLNAFFKKFECKAAKLDAEIIELAGELKGVLLDTPKERRHIADIMNKIYLEALDNSNLGKVITDNGGTLNGVGGSIKRLERIFVLLGKTDSIDSLMMPLYVLYDLRVAWSHLMPTDSMAEKMQSICDRLGLDHESSYSQVYDRLVDQLALSLKEMTEILLKA